MSEFTVLPLELRRSSGDTHELEGMCVPYGRTSLKAGYPRGERFLPGALRGVVESRAKVRLYDRHVGSATPGTEPRPVGVSIGFDESDGGVLGRFRIYNTPEGRSAYENLSEETFGGLSLGFVSVKDRRGSDGAREIVEAKLHHVALVDEPAYVEAKVLAVRAAREPLPDVAEILGRAYDFDAMPDRVDLAAIHLE